MSHRYQAVHWNQHKRVYDVFIVGAMAAYLIVFIGVLLATTPPTEVPSDPIIAIRALGSLAILMLHVVLAIGPLARISPLFNVLLYNRRHLGVFTALIATAHGGLNLVWYFGFGEYANPIAAAFATSGGFGSLLTFPFHLLGMLALVILIVLASTSHDYWLRNLSPRAWKWLHMSVYLAYALVLAHVLLGAAQAGRGGNYAWLLGSGFVVIAGLHLIAGLKENSKPELRVEGEWVDAGPASELRDGAAKTVRLRDGQSLAVFRDGDEFWALSNVCAHQQGPLGEGRVVGGCATCPWHGHQFKLDSGQAPAPFDERVPAYRVLIRQGHVLVHTEPADPGEKLEPARLSASPADRPPAPATTATPASEPSP